MPIACPYCHVDRESAAREAILICYYIWVFYSVLSTESVVESRPPREERRIFPISTRAHPGRGEEVKRNKSNRNTVWIGSVYKLRTWSQELAELMQSEDEDATRDKRQDKTRSIDRSGVKNANIALLQIVESILRVYYWKNDEEQKKKKRRMNTNLQ